MIRQRRGDARIQALAESTGIPAEPARSKARKELVAVGVLEAVEKVRGKDGVGRPANKIQSNADETPLPTVGSDDAESSESEASSATEAPSVFVDEADDEPRDENLFREPLTMVESVEQGMRLETLEKPKAKERQANTGPSSGKGKKAIGSGKSPEPVKGDTRDKVSAVIGMSGSTYEVDTLCSPDPPQHSGPPTPASDSLLVAGAGGEEQ